MRGFWYCLFASSPLWTLYHRTIVDHLVASDTAIAVSEAGGSVISVWEREIKSSVALPPRCVVDRLGFLSPSSLGAVITRDDAPPLFWRIEEGRIDEEHPLSSSVIHMAHLKSNRVVVVNRIGTIQTISNDTTDENTINHPAGFSSACGRGGIVCASTFDGNVIVWDDNLREVARYGIDPMTPISRMACARIGGGIAIVSSRFGREAEITVTVVSGGEARTGPTVRIEAKEVCSIHIEGEDVFVLDESGAIHHFTLSQAATRHARRFVFPDSRQGIIDNIAVTNGFLIHNEGSRVHVWPRRGREAAAERERTTRKMLPPASNPIIEQWLQIQAFLSDNTTTQN